MADASQAASAGEMDLRVTLTTWRGSSLLGDVTGMRGIYGEK
jgi:hypothetical protein